jgi:hypothetical protein
LVSKFELKVDVGIDRSSLVFHSIHVIGLYRFIQVIDFEVFGKVLINEQSTVITLPNHMYYVMFAPCWTYDLIVIDLTTDYHLYSNHTKSYSWSYSVLV